MSTAVEWLIEQICGNHTSEWQKQIKKAKEIEKEQSIKFGKIVADKWGMIPIPLENIEDIYNETYLQSHTPKHYRVWFPDVMEAIGGYWWHAVTDSCGRLYDPKHPNEERDTVQWYIDNGYKIEEVTNG